jgi:hypothetical protein
MVKNTKNNIKRTKNKKIKRTKKIKKGGELKENCLADPKKFPKCGAQGCVYLNEDQSNVTKQQWVPHKDMPGHDLSVEGQANSSSIAPKVFSYDKKPCDLISIKGSENKAPCFVKRIRTTRSGKKILYEEEKRDSWCRNYGKNSQCVVDKTMYDKFKDNVIKTSIDITDETPIPPTFLPQLDAKVISEDEDLPDQVVTIPEEFTGINPVYLTNITMDRIKGITINELIKEMFIKLGEKKTMSVAELWQEEQAKLIALVQSYGYMSDDFHEDNIMIDVDKEELCEYIDETLDDGDAISPEMIKDYFSLKKDSNILKIVDWGMLRRVKAKSLAEVSKPTISPKGSAAAEQEL